MSSMRIVLMLVFITFISTSCSTPKAVFTPREGTTLLLKNHTKPFIITEDSVQINPIYYIGELSTKHTRFTGKCNIRQVNRFAEMQGREIGGNLFVVTAVKIPNSINQCYRLSGPVYKVPNPLEYEREIKWSKNRQLKIADFKGSTDNRPFVAATSSYFGYFTTMLPKEKSFLIEIDTYFNCKKSYFKLGEHDDFNIAHEQLHFDITEVYARKFLERVEKEIVNFNDYVYKIERIGDQLNYQLQQEQDAYDTDVYTNLSTQILWQEKIDNALLKSRHLEDKRLIKPYK